MDLFDKIEPNEDTFIKIEKAEDRDVTAIRELVNTLYEVYKDEDELNGALCYFAKLGLSLDDAECARIMLSCITSFNEQFDALEQTLRILESQRSDEKTDQLITLAKVKSIIIRSTEDADFCELTRSLSQMYDEYSAYARLYLASERLRYTGNYEKEKIDSLAEALDVPSLVALPVFTGKDPEVCAAPRDAEKECEALRFALMQIDMDEWRDFWLAAMYEYVQIYLSKDLTKVGNDILKSLKSRCTYPKKKLHILSVLKYLCNKGKDEYKDEYDALLKECIFDGLSVDLDTDEACEELIKNAIYTCSKEERRKAKFSSKLGAVIEHTKNRYLLKAALDNHQKRGNKHLWEMTISIKSGHKESPMINPIRISERYNEVNRGGVTLDKEKKQSQVIARGEIQIAEKLYPLELDLILDISYVSSTKCELCEIKIKDYTREENYIVMQSILAIY